MQDELENDEEAAIKFLERLKSDPIVCTKIRLCGKKVKEMLSTCKIAKLRINHLVDDFEYSSELTSAELSYITSDFIQMTKDLMTCALEDSYIQLGDVDEFVLLSESSNLVSVQETLSEMLGADKINRGFNPDTTVAIGAAAYAYAVSCYV